MFKGIFFLVLCLCSNAFFVYTASAKRKGKKSAKLFEDTSQQPPQPAQNYGAPGPGYMDPTQGNK